MSDFNPEKQFKYTFIKFWGGLALGATVQAKIKNGNRT